MRKGSGNHARAEDNLSPFNVVVYVSVANRLYAYMSRMEICVFVLHEVGSHNALIA